MLVNKELSGKVALGTECPLLREAFMNSDN